MSLSLALLRIWIFLPLFLLFLKPKSWQKPKSWEKPKSWQTNQFLLYSNKFLSADFNNGWQTNQFLPYSNNFFYQLTLKMYETSWLLKLYIIIENSQRISQRIPKEFPKNSQRILKKFPKNSPKIEEFPQKFPRFWKYPIPYIALRGRKPFRAWGLKQKKIWAASSKKNTYCIIKNGKVSSFSNWNSRFRKNSEGICYFYLSTHQFEIALL